jgi:Domain of unknown function (DUF5615)
MALRFLADHCVSNSTVQSLREANHEVLRLKDVLPVESSDTLVITKAQEIDAILLSLNGDFSHIINYPPKNYKGIVALHSVGRAGDLLRSPYSIKDAKRRSGDCARKVTELTPGDLSCVASATERAERQSDRRAEVSRGCSRSCRR